MHRVNFPPSWIGPLARRALWSLALIMAAWAMTGPANPAALAQGTPTITPERTAALVANDLGLIFTYPAAWTAQPLAYQDFGFRISSPDLSVDPIGRPDAGGYLAAITVPQSLAAWRSEAAAQAGERFTLAGLEAIEGPIARVGAYAYRSWQIYGFGQHYTLTFGAAAPDFDRLLPTARQIIDQLVFIGAASAPPRPIQGPVRLVAFQPILLGFAAGPGKVMSGYNNGDRHTGGDLYAMDFCGGSSTCSFMPVGADVLAPTTMKLVYSLNSLRQDVKDFHFFELSADYGGRRLCMSFGHMQTTLAINQTATRGQKIGTILLLDGNANHIHMGLFTVAKTANCAQTPRTALPYAAAQGGQSLDGVDYPTSGGVNEWKNTVVNSTNMLSGPTATGTLPITRTNAGTLTATRTATVTGTATGTAAATGTASLTAPPSMTATASGTAVPRPATIGVFKDGVWVLRLANTAGPADLTVNFGGPGFLPVVGDWNGDGVDTVGVFNPQAGTFSLSDSNLPTPSVDHAFVLGDPGDLPIAGRWEAAMIGDGAGVYRPTNGILYEKKILTSGFADYFAIFGNPGDYGFAGDWDGDGFDSVGIYRPSVQNWYLTNNGTPTGITFSDLDFVWDIGRAVPVIGDWALTGKSSVGSFDAGIFTLHAAAAATGTNTVFAFGPTDGLPVAGRWVR